MSLRIAGVDSGGLASRHGIHPGDELLALNDCPINDAIDLLYAGSDEVVVAEFRRDGKVFTRRLVRPSMENFGLRFDEPKTRWCSDDCIFCFVHQNPDGVRPSLMVQDEDYRLSFLHGNYITLDNLGEADFTRIFEMGLSPLYVSVHTTDPDLRQRMVRGRRSGDLMPRLKRLLEGGIQIHTQVVVVPDWNDGPRLARTVRDLAELAPGVQSVAVVPLGLTDHRKGLTPLRRHTPEQMGDILDDIEQWQTVYRERMGHGFVYAADEYFLASGRPLPPLEWYDAFFQQANGVGMATRFVDDFLRGWPRLQRALQSFQECYDRPMRVVACTGLLGEELFRRHLLEPLATARGLRFELTPVTNTFFGPSITIAGLLTARCLAAALERVELSDADLLLLPSTCTNGQEVFLDDETLDAFARRYPCPVRRGASDLAGELAQAAEQACRSRRQSG